MLKPLLPALPPSDLRQAVEDLGAGEILLNCIDCDGVGQGFDIELVAAVSGARLGRKDAGWKCARYMRLHQAVHVCARHAVLLLFRPCSCLCCCLLLLLLVLLRPRCTHPPVLCTRRRGDHPRDCQQRGGRARAL